MSPDKQQIKAQLRRVKGPDLSDNIVDLGMVSEIVVEGGRVTFSIGVPPERAAELEPMRKAAERVVSEVAGVASVAAVLTAEVGNAASRSASTPHISSQGRRANPPAGVSHAGSRPRNPSQVPGIKHMIAVASGKGGVGKSTTATNLALGFKTLGLSVGVLDADIFGPSQPRLLGLAGQPDAKGDRLVAMEAYGLKVMSIGFLVGEATPMIWRGPMVTQALGQMLRQVEWGELDVLVIDMPPGTGDVPLTMAQEVPLSGAVIVSTPQDLALIDARRGLAMFRQVDIPVLGIVENMSTFVCPTCGATAEIFGHGGAKREAEKLGVAFLGAVPLHIDIRITSDEGRPLVVVRPDGAHARSYCDIAARAWGELQASVGSRPEPPKLALIDDATKLYVTFEGAAPFDLSAEMLRVMSPSAEVQGHTPAERIVVPKKRSVRIAALHPVGNYAVRIDFDDGHRTGIYSWPYLQALHRERDIRWAAYLSELEQKGLHRD